MMIGFRRCTPGCRLLLTLLCAALVTACASRPEKHTLAELRDVEPETTEIQIDDSLDKAMASYRSFLAQTPTNAKTPEAMRRLADLQIEKEYGIMGGTGITELPAPEPERSVAQTSASSPTPDALTFDQRDQETDAEFERRTTGQTDLPTSTPLNDAHPDEPDQHDGPRQAIETYKRILAEYPHYERNDQVLYQMARAYDELAEPDEAMAVMERLIAQYGHSELTAEVYFRRAEYYFVRRKYLDAEEAYAAVAEMGADTEFYELALYKLGWSFYKQELYEDALHQYMALLDYKHSLGYDFERLADLADREPNAAGGADPTQALGADDADADPSDAASTAEPAQDERRVADTFRVISLAFSNLGGPEVLNEYFSRNGKRAYENRIYSNLGEFYLDKRRFNDAATVYESFASQNPFHSVAPHFAMRVVEIYEQGGFAQLVVEAKKSFATLYGLKADYWQHYDVNKALEVQRFLMTNLQDLATHYHSLYQDEGLVEQRPDHYREALQWYGEFLDSFPKADATPSINYRLADLLFEHKDFREAALAYERTAYTYDPHDQDAAAGYAAIYAHREHLKVVAEDDELQARRDTVESSLRFADAFAGHEHAATVLGAAAEDLYDMNEFNRAIVAGRLLIERHADADVTLLRSAWSVVANSSFDVMLYADAETAYSTVLSLSAEDDDARQDLFDNLAAAIYKQGEAASVAEDHRTAANHFLRIKTTAPTSAIRPSAEYDAAAALMKLEDWLAAAAVFEDFRDTHTDHELVPEATKQLGYVYREAGELSRAASEYERVADDAHGVEDETLHREAVMLAGELYEEAEDERALTLFIRYVESFPQPVEQALEVRAKIARTYQLDGEDELYLGELRQIVAIEADAGAEQTPRTRYLAATSSLALTELLYTHFTELALTQPFQKSLAEKQTRMDAAMSAFEALVEYEVAEVTAAATFYMAEIYSHFGHALLDSERPDDLAAAELADYELAIEEEAFPFEENAIDVHKKNHELMMAGTFNSWIQSSLDRLAVLMPGRYAKTEISSGFIGPVEVFAYRSPAARMELAGVESDGTNYD